MHENENCDNLIPVICNNVTHVTCDEIPLPTSYEPIIISPRPNINRYVSDSTIVSSIIFDRFYNPKIPCRRKFTLTGVYKYYPSKKMRKNQNSFLHRDRKNCSNFEEILPVKLRHKSDSDANYGSAYHRKIDFESQDMSFVDENGVKSKGVDKPRAISLLTRVYENKTMFNYQANEPDKFGCNEFLIAERYNNFMEHGQTIFLRRIHSPSKNKFNEISISTKSPESSVKYRKKEGRSRNSRKSFPLSGIFSISSSKVSNNNDNLAYYDFLLFLVCTLY